MTLKEARFHQGLSQWDLSIKTGLHQSKVSLIERGYIEPTPIERERISKALGVKPEVLTYSTLSEVKP